MGTRRLSVLVVVGLIASLIPVAVTAAPADRAGFGIEVVSSPAHLVSGDDARLQVTVPTGLVDKVAITVDGRDVTDAFSSISATMLEGVVEGLALGENTVQVRNRHSRGAALASATLVNHPITGPMFSGPQQEPFLCSTAGDRVNAELGEPLDADCSMETVVSFKYRTTSGEWKGYEPGTDPGDMAQTTTLDGDTVDFIVRWERGTINRFIYSIAVLSPDSQDVADVDLSAWNDRLIYHFQGGVGIGHYQGDPSRSRMLYEFGLSDGYAVVYSTGTKTGEHYNLELGGETAIMVKDRFVSAYGLPVYTVGIGASGGAIQQYVYGQNHPGLIDAAIPVYSYPDMVTQTIHVGDCELLERWIDLRVVNGDAKWANWESRTLLEGMNALNGFENPYLAVMPPGFPEGSSECVNGWRGLSPLALNPLFGTAPGVTPQQQASTEWTHYADAVNVYGVNPDDGFANSTWDNVGVQYGLESLVAGDITKAEFLDLNFNVGSWKNEPDMIQEGCPFIAALCPTDPSQLDGLDPFPDIWPNILDPWSWRNMALSDGDDPAPRRTADDDAIENAYEHGHVFVGDMEIPIIDWRNHLESELNMHNSHQSFAARQRLLNHDGDASNQVIWFTAGNGDPEVDGFDQTPLAFEVIDEWMASIAAHPGRSVAENKPDRAVDACFDVDGDLVYMGDDAWSGILDEGPEGPCTEAMPIFSTSRIVAGGPITGDVFKCHLQPVDDAISAGVYGEVEFTAEELAMLDEIFPTGVCDHSQGGARRP